MKVRNFAFFFAALLFTTGCTRHSGSEELASLSEKSVKELIQNGKTTKSEIIEHFGTKYALEEDGEGNERWAYEFNSFKPGVMSYIPYVNLVGANGKEKTCKLLVVFDEEGVVLRHRFSTNEHVKARWKGNL